MVVVVQISKNGNIMLRKMLRCEIIDTVAGKNTKDIFFSKKSEIMLIWSGRMAFVISNTNSKINAITLPGKGKGNIEERRSPMQQSTNIRIICRKNLTFVNPLNSLFIF